jgi:hypothetical protein
VHRFILLTGLVAAVAAVFAAVAVAGSPHFIDNSLSATTSGNTLVVSGKEAGLGDELQVDILVTASAACINPGGNHPEAANKESFSAEGQFPVQNGKAEFSLTLTAAFQPDCSPPMSVQWSDVTITDLTNGISATL